MGSIQQQGEIQELISRVQSPEVKERAPAFERLVALDAQNVDCSSAFPAIHMVPDPSKENYLRLRRFVGIFNERYLETCPNIAENVISDILNLYERPDPQLKGVIVRQIGRIVNDANVDRLIPVIMRACSSDDPYVRKSAALSILAIHQARASFVEKFKLGAQLKRLVEDSNPNVAANAVSTLMEINLSRDNPLFEPTFVQINNLLASIDQTTEWAQVQILDFATTFRPANESDARGIISRVSSRLSHANAAVVISAIRCCLQMNMFVQDPSKIRETLTRVSLPLVTLLNNTAPIQYVAVKSILILLQHYKRMLSSEVTIFFCKFDDPLYMKLAKLDVILVLCSAQNVSKVLEELYDYAQQADVEFVRKSIAAIGKIAVNFESAAGYCVDKIVALVKTKVQYVIQECIVVAVDIFRRYPMTYLGIVGEICNALDGPLDDHRAKAAMVWILGEYADRIGNAGDLIENLFLDDFLEDTPDVQLAIITAAFKYFLVDNEDGQDMLQRVITMATSQVDNPDVRDRAFMYFWLVNECPDVAAAIISPEETVTLKSELYSVDTELVEKLIPQIGTLSVLYNRPPEEFVEATRIVNMTLDGIDDLGLAAAEQMDLPIVVPGQQQRSLEVRGTLQQIGTESSIVLRLTNYADNDDEIKNIAFNKNIFGFAPGELPFPKAIAAGKSVTVQIRLQNSPEMTVGAVPKPALEVAIQTNSANAIIFAVPIKVETLLVTAEEGGKLSRQDFMGVWGSIPAESEIAVDVSGARLDTIAVAKTKLQQSRLFFTAKKDNTAFFSGRTVKGDTLIAFLVFNGNGQVQVGIRMQNQQMAQIIVQLLSQLVK